MSFSFEINTLVESKFFVDISNEYKFIKFFQWIGLGQYTYKIVEIIFHNAKA